jgi:hypothetical protein
VAHSSGSGAAAHNFAINHGDPEAAAGELVRTGGAYNSGTHNYYVVGRVGHGFSFARRYFELVYTTLLEKAGSELTNKLAGFTTEGTEGHRGISVSACWL